MPKYLSGRVRRTPQDQLTDNRYEFLALEQAEPNLGSPPMGGSSGIPGGTRMQLISVVEDINKVNRYWVPLQGGLIPGSMSIFNENVLVGGSASTTDLNFVGVAVTAIGDGTGGSDPGIAVTIKMLPPGDVGSVLFKENIYDPNGAAGFGTHRDDFNTSSDLVFNSTVGILTVGNGIDIGIGGTIITAFSGISEGVGVASVGIGTTNPTQNLHVAGNLRLEGTIYDFNNDAGDQSNILTRGATGVEWVSSNAITAGAGGTIYDIQYHNTAGYVDGASNFVWNSVDQRVGIGSTQPVKLLDVFGSARFSELEVTGLSTFVGVSSFNGTIFSGVSTSYSLHQDRVVWVGIGSTLQDSPNLKFNGTGLNVIGVVTTTDLKVSGASTVGNIKSFDNTIQTISGNLTIAADGGTIETPDVLYISQNIESYDTDSGSLLIDGGAGINGNLNVGGGLSITGPTYGEGEVVGVAVTLAAAGGITTTGGDFYIGGDLYVNDDLFLDEGNFQKLIVNPGVSTFLGSVELGIGATVGFGSTGYFGYNTKAIFNDNLEIFAGDDSIIRHTKTGAGNDLSIESDTAVYIGTVELSQTMASFSSGGAVELYENGTWRFKTTSSGIEVNGTVTDTGANHNGSVVFFGSDGSSEGVKWDKAGNQLLFLDEVKSIFGTTADGLEIFHENDNSYIRDSGTGSLLINGSAVQINSANDSVQMISAAEGDSVKLFYNNIERLSTSGAGITVSNQLDTTNLSVSGITTIGGALYDKNNSYGAENGYLLETRQSDGVQWVSTGDLTVNNANRVSIGSTNISLTSEFEAAGIGTYYMSFVENANPHDGRENEFLYSSTNIVFDVLQNRVGIGTTRPHETLEILSANPVIRLNDSDPFGVYSQIDGAGGDLILTADGGAGSDDSFISFRTDGTDASAEKVRITGFGSFGIGTNDPKKQVQIQGDNPWLRLETGDASSKRIELYVGTSGIGTIAAPQSSSQLSFRTVDDERLRINATGITSIIGQDDQDNFIVDVDGTEFAIHTDATDGEISLRAQDQDGSANPKYMTFYTHPNGVVESVERLRITSDGDVNIGSHHISNPFTYLRFGASQFGAADIRPIDEEHHRIGLSFYTDGTVAPPEEEGGPSLSDINPTEKMRITSGGDIVVNHGGTDPTHTASSGSIFLSAPSGINTNRGIMWSNTSDTHYVKLEPWVIDGLTINGYSGVVFATGSRSNDTWNERVRIDGSGHLLPGDLTENQIQDIGSNDNRWNKIYARDINITGEIDISGDVEVQDLLVVGLSTFNGKVNILNNHILHFGATGYDTDGELQIYLDQPSDQSTIYSPNKILSLMSGDRVEIEDQIGSNIAVFTKDGSSELYYRGSVGAGSSGSKLETSGLGVTVYGSLDSDNLNVSGVSTFYGDSYHNSNVGIGTSVPTDPVLSTNTSILAVGEIKSNKVTAQEFIGEGDNGIGYSLYSYSSSFNSNAVAGIDTVAKAGWNLYEYTLLFRSDSTHWSQSQKLLVMDNDGLTPEVSTQEYGVMSSNDLLVSLDAQVSGDNIIIQATPLGAVGGMISYKLLRTTLS